MISVARPRGLLSSERAVDLLVIAVVGVPTGMDAWWNAAGTRQADWLTYLLLVVSLGALLGRRRWPLGVTVVCGVALSWWYLLGHHGEALNLPTMVGLYTVAVQGNRRRSVIVGVVAAAWSGGLAMVAGNPVGSPMLEMAWPAVPLLLGEVVRGRRELLDEYAARTERAEADREQAAQRRVDEERLRIAREVHDIVAHSLAAVNVHMGVAVSAFESRPEAAQQALVQARTSSREALHELRTAVAVLRQGDGAEPMGPVPGLAQIDELVAAARGSGLDVTLVRTGLDPAAPGVSPVVGLAAYRIVQEALSNVLRHAGARTVTVTLTRQGSTLDVEVADEGSRACRISRSDVGPN